jgi:hypothetical protein
MSDDRVIATLREHLVTGATRRRRWERRRAGVLVAVPVAVALVAGVVWARDDGDGPGTVSAGVVSEPAVLAACNAVHDWWNGSQVFDREGYAAARATFSREAAASGDAVLVDLGRRTAAAPTEDEGNVEVGRVMQEASKRCEALDAPGFRPQYVAAPIGPVPNVHLEDYGTVVAWGPVRDEVPEGLVRAARGRALSTVEAAVTPLGGYVAHWTYTGANGAQFECRTVGGDTANSQGCGPVGQVDQQPPPGMPVTSSGSGSAEEVLLATAQGVAFVVVRGGDAAYVQRPVLGRVVLPVPRKPVGTSMTIRAYDVDGMELACTMLQSGSPLVPGDAC